jgi:hypothetical protein
MTWRVLAAAGGTKSRARVSDSSGDIVSVIALVILLKSRVDALDLQHVGIQEGWRAGVMWARFAVDEVCWGARLLPHYRFHERTHWQPALCHCCCCCLAQAGCLVGLQ